MSQESLNPSNRTEKEETPAQRAERLDRLDKLRAQKGVLAKARDFKKKLKEGEPTVATVFSSPATIPTTESGPTDSLSVEVAIDGPLQWTGDQIVPLDVQTVPPRTEIDIDRLAQRLAKSAGAGLQRSIYGGASDVSSPQTEQRH